MAHAVGFMQVDLSVKISPFAFATDASGESAIDEGGWGTVVTKINLDDIHELLEQGEHPGLTIARMGELGGAKYPSKCLIPTVPFSMLSQPFFDSHRWSAVLAGRWQFVEHITLKETRVVVKLVRLLSNWPAFFRTAVFSLQDNRPAAGALGKGRSPTFWLNRLLRMKSSICIACQIRLMLPWVESENMPADEISRALPHHDSF